eukprot:1546763-Amphidinium_carterae.1
MRCAQPQSLNVAEKFLLSAALLHRALSPFFGWLLEVLGGSLGGHDHVHEVEERLVLGVIDSL